jgi:Tfp pilus assembly protein PilF
MKFLSLVVALLMITSLAACSTTSVNENSSPTAVLAFENDLFGERQNIISISAIHELSDKQRLAFERYFDNPRNQDQPAHRRVSDYLETITSDFSYHGETYSASEALEHSAGNCLALAILTTALARIADVDIAYELIDSAPVFESRGKQINRGQHVRSMLYDPTWVAAEDVLVFSRPGVKVDYFPSDFDRFVGNINESEYFSMYFRNIAADAIEDEDLSKAYWLLLESLELSPNNSDSLNMLAIVYYRSGDTRKSEEIYRFGIQNSPRQVSLLRNYGIFLRRQGRPAEAEKMDTMLAELDDPNPFDWLYAGNEAYRDGEFRRAVKFFKKSIELAPYLHESHFGLARTYFRIGNLTAAEQELAKALSNSYRSSTRGLYEAKLAALIGNRHGSSPR